MMLRWVYPFGAVFMTWTFRLFVDNFPLHLNHSIYPGSDVHFDGLFDLFIRHFAKLMLCYFEHIRLLRFAIYR